MQLLAWAPLAAPLPRRSEVETLWNSFSRDRTIAAERIPEDLRSLEPRRVAPGDAEAGSSYLLTSWGILEMLL